MTRQKNTSQTDNPPHFDGREAHWAGIKRGLLASAIILIVAWVFHDEPKPSVLPTGSSPVRQHTSAGNSVGNKLPSEVSPQTLSPAKEMMTVLIVSEDRIGDQLLQDLQGAMISSARLSLGHMSSVPAGITLSSLPACLVLTTDGREIKRWEGCLPIAEIRQFLTQTEKSSATDIDAVENGTP